MRVLVALLAALLIAAALPTPRDGSPAGGRLATPDAVPESRAAKLDQLFETLRNSRDAESSRAAQRAILAIWIDSGSSTIDVMMDWSLKAMSTKDYPAALDFLDRVVTLKPDYVEGWNKRATVYYLTDDYAKAIVDIERVLAIEPRHFGALTGLGSILRDLGEDEKALAVYRRILEIDPQIEQVKEAVEELTAKGAGGRDL